MASKSFTIAKVSWLTSTAGNEARHEFIVRHFQAVVGFLQDNALVRRPLVQRLEDIDDDFSLESDDLTDQGLAVMKLAYDKWLKKVDRGMDPSNVTLLRNALLQIRAM